MKQRFLFLFLFPFLAARAEPDVAQLLGDRAPTAILRTMPSDTPANQRLDGLRFIAGYEVIGRPAPIPTDRAAALTAALKNPSAFDSAQNEEHMRPGIAYRFGEGATAVDLLVCFSCDKVAFIPAGAEGITTTHHITQAARDVLLGLAKELLPGDDAIQELPKVRSPHPIPPPPAPVPKDAPLPGQATSSGTSR